MCVKLVKYIDIFYLVGYTTCCIWIILLRSALGFSYPFFDLPAKIGKNLYVY